MTRFEPAREFVGVHLVAGTAQRDERDPARSGADGGHARRLPGSQRAACLRPRPAGIPSRLDVTVQRVLVVRHARTGDVPAIKALVDTYAGPGRRLLGRDLVGLYEDVPDFRVAELDGVVVGCGGLHVLWADLGEIRTLAVRPDRLRRGIGDAVLGALIEAARELGLGRLFALTFQTHFFARHGFVEIDGTPVDHDTYEALRRSYDPGVAEFLGLEYVKPNTLGNARMLMTL